MKINYDAEKKIVAFVIEKNYQQTTSDIPEKGHYFVESNFVLATNKKDNNHIFVISDKLHYHNYSISKVEKEVYAFDNSGNKIENFDEKNVYFGFFKDLKNIKKII